MKQQLTEYLMLYVLSLSLPRHVRVDRNYTDVVLGTIFESIVCFIVQCVKNNNHKNLNDCKKCFETPAHGCNTLQINNTENLKQIFPEKELCGRSPNFHIHVSVIDCYIPNIHLPILQQEICGPILGIQHINRSQTHECVNWD